MCFSPIALATNERRVVTVVNKASEVKPSEVTEDRFKEEYIIGFWTFGHAESEAEVKLEYYSREWRHGEKAQD